MAPRKRGSVWAPSNQERVARLVERGLMTPRGLSVVEAAKADGSWNALDAVMALEVPHDLRAALDAHPPAAEFFEGFTFSQKQMALGWIEQAKTPATRERRIRETADAASLGLRANRWRRPADPA